MDLSILQSSTLFAGLSVGEIEELCRDLGAYRRSYAARSFLWLRGESVSAAGVVLRGSVQAERVGRDGELQIVAQHYAGGLFGEVLMGARQAVSPFDIVALADTEVLFLPLVNMMREGVARNGGAITRFRLNLLSEIAEKYWAQQRRIDLYSTRSLRGRIALWLCGKKDGNAMVELPTSREIWAGQLGVNRSALSRELSRMAEEGIVSLRRREIRILDVAALEEYAK